MANHSHSSSSVNLNAAWIELMLTHSSNLNLSSAFNFTTEQIDLSDSNFSGDNQKLLHLFDLNLFQQSTINVSMKNNEQQVDIQFVDL